MIYEEYGKENTDVMLLLHGGGLSWWNYRAAAELLGVDYHVILPVMDGHAGSDRDFTTMERNAEEILEFVDGKFGGQVLLMAGLSLGGQILLEILAQRGDACRFAVVESALAEPSRWMHAMIAPAFGSCCGLIQYRWFARLQFRSLGMPPALFAEYYRDTCRITKQNMVAFLQANVLYGLKDLSACTAQVHVFVGSREKGAMLRSAKRIHKAIPGSTLRILPHMGHGEFSLNHPEEYARTLREIAAL